MWFLKSTSKIIGLFFSHKIRSISVLRTFHLKKKSENLLHLLLILNMLLKGESLVLCCKLLISWCWSPCRTLCIGWIYIYTCVNTFVCIYIFFLFYVYFKGLISPAIPISKHELLQNEMSLYYIIILYVRYYIILRFPTGLF